MWKNKKESAKYLGITTSTFDKYVQSGVIEIPEDAREGNRYRPELFSFNKSKDVPRNKIGRHESISALEEILHPSDAANLYDRLYTLTDYASKMNMSRQNLHYHIKYLKVVQFGSTKLIVDCPSNRELFTRK